MNRFVYILSALGAVGAVAWFVTREMQFSAPAPLHGAHAGLEADCFTGHDTDRTVDKAKCSGCHAHPITGEPLALTGFASHHFDADLDCLTCHTEHKGAGGRLTRPDHTLAQTACSTCHERHAPKGHAFRLAGADHPHDTLHAHGPAEAHAQPGARIGVGVHRREPQSPP